MIIDFLTYNLKKKLAQEVERAESAETALKIDSFAGVEYDSSGKTIDFYNGYGNKIDSIDASDFVVDGMIENVYLSGTNLYIIFNTEAGKQDIVIDLTTLVNPERLDEIEEVTSIALNDLNSRMISSADVETQITNKNYVASGDVVSALALKQDTLSAGTNVTITDNVISVDVDFSNLVTKDDLRTVEEVISTAINNLNNRLAAIENGQ